MNNFLLPHPLLRPYIRAYLHRTVDFTQDETSNFHFCTPTTRKFVMLYLGSSIKVGFENGKSEEKKDMLVIGPMSKSVTISFGKEHRLVAIEMQNTGHFYLLGGCPIHTIMDCNIEADALFGNSVNELIQRLTDTLCPEKIKDELDHFFIHRLNNNKRAVEPVDILLNNIPEGKTLSELASIAGLSTRQLERKYKDKTGMSPAFYNKLNRFTNAYNLKEINPAMKWTEIAHHCGYFDQMHLIRDFRFFLGYNPGSVNKILQQQYKGYINDIH